MYICLWKSWRKYIFLKIIVCIEKAVVFIFAWKIAICFGEQRRDKNFDQGYSPIYLAGD